AVRRVERVPPELGSEPRLARAPQEGVAALALRDQADRSAVEVAQRAIGDARRDRQGLKNVGLAQGAVERGLRRNRSRVRTKSETEPASIRLRVVEAIDGIGRAVVALVLRALESSRLLLLARVACGRERPLARPEGAVQREAVDPGALGVVLARSVRLQV